MWRGSMGEREREHHGEERYGDFSCGNAHIVYTEVD